MSDVWFTSDTHFCHKNIIQYCNRPFASIDEMNEKIIENWNKNVKPGDRVYHLGDFGFASPPKLAAIFDRLNGQKYLIEGNHDSDSVDKRIRWIWIKDTYSLKADGKYYFLAHYAHRVWNRSFHGARHLFGHTHGMAKPWGFSCDVGVDCWDYTPVNLDTIEQLMSKLPRYVEEEANAQPAGQIWQGRQCMLTFKNAFFGDGSYDNVNPDDIVEKDPESFKSE